MTRIVRLFAASVLVVLSASVALSARPRVLYRVLPLPFEGIAEDLGNRGEVIGSGSAAHPGRGFIWSERQGLQLIEPLSNDNEGSGVSWALAINDRGQIAGATTVEGSSQHAYLRGRSGTLRDLGALGPFSHGFSFAQATALNNRGEVIGQSSTPSDEYHAFLWTTQTGMVDLGANAVASDINNRGQIVGTISNQAVLWTDVDTWREFGIFGVSPLGAFASSANAINDRGWVVGGSTAAEGGAFLWTPQGGDAESRIRPAYDRLLPFQRGEGYK
jgi:probable HAF family extracellular repeat protein